jgi:hypothetical protein
MKMIFYYCLGPSRSHQQTVVCCCSPRICGYGGVGGGEGLRGGGWGVRAGYIYKNFIGQTQPQFFLGPFANYIGSSATPTLHQCCVGVGAASFGLGRLYRDDSGSGSLAQTC